MEPLRTIPDLSKIGIRLAIIDETLVGLIAIRIASILQVEKTKRATGVQMSDEKLKEYAHDFEVDKDILKALFTEVSQRLSIGDNLVLFNTTEHANKYSIPPKVIGEIFARAFTHHELMHPDPIIRIHKDIERMDAAKVLGEQYGVDPIFVQAIQRILIDNSCKLQIKQREESIAAPDPEARMSDNEYFDHLRANLLKLIADVAGVYDEFYEQKPNFALGLYHKYEMSLIEEALVRSSRDVSEGRVLDLGCATGIIMSKIAERYPLPITGIDISEHLLNIARGKEIPESEFHCHDLENGIPFENNTFSFVVASRGSASAIRDIGKLLGEIHRVLKVGGRALLSFYNRESVLYNFAVIPWPLGLQARVDMDASALEVSLPGKKRYRIYASAHKYEKIVSLLPDGLIEEKTRTFPTLAGLLPHYMMENDKLKEKVTDMMENDKLKKKVTEIDEALASTMYGNHLIMTLVKRK